MPCIVVRSDIQPVYYSCTWTVRQQDDIVTQILTQEDWHEVLYMGMANTSAWAALYFILLMTFGNYVLFNLLVAILVEGFSAQAEVG